MDKEMEYQIIRTQKHSIDALYEMFEATSRFCLEHAPNEDARREMLRLIVAADQLHKKSDTISEGYLALRNEKRDSL